MTAMRSFSTVKGFSNFSFLCGMHFSACVPAMESDCLGLNSGSIALLRKEMTSSKFSSYGNLSFLICRMGLTSSSLGEFKGKQQMKVFGSVLIIIKKTSLVEMKSYYLLIQALRTSKVGAEPISVECSLPYLIPYRTESQAADG